MKENQTEQTDNNTEKLSGESAYKHVLLLLNGYKRIQI